MALVTLIITAVNDIPVAANDIYTTPVNVPLAVAGPGVLLNDTDVENDPLTAVLDAAPLHGTLDLDANGAFLYTPAPHFVGVAHLHLSRQRRAGQLQPGYGADRSHRPSYLPPTGEQNTRQSKAAQQIGTASRQSAH